MKQISLLDSFMKRQSSNKKQQPSTGTPSDKKTENQNKQRANPRKSKLVIDSDEEKEVSSVQNHMEHMDMVDENNDENRVKTSRSKSANKKVKIQQQPPDTPKDVPGDQETDPLSQFTDATPQWAQREHCLDKQMRGPSHPFYDPTTLHIPESAWSKFTAPMKQFWRVKSDNFDKVVLFKLGKFYELFYDDAAVGNQYLDLKYMGTKMHTGFPEKCLERYAGELVQLGFKTVIVEQMETPEQMEARVKDDRKQGRKSEKTLNREITQVLTKGTFVSQEEPNESYLPTYLLALRMHGQSYGFALLEMGTNEIAMGMVEDLEKLKTVLYQTRPVELVYDPDNVNFEVCGMMEKTFLHMQMSKVPNIKNIWHPLHALGELGRLAAENKTQLPKIFEVIDQMPETQKNILYSTLSGLFAYLQKVLKFEYVVGSVRYTFYQRDMHARNMILDSQALQHLEIFETADGAAGSLFSLIDKTKTKFGRRLLRKWMMCPLMNQFHIEQRLNAIEDFDLIKLERERVCGLFRQLPDLDKKINKLYHYAVKTTSASKAIYFEDFNKAKLKEFKETMEKLETAWEAMGILRTSLPKFRSVRLRQLVTISSEARISDEDIYSEDEDDQSTLEGLLPNVTANLEEFKSYVKWENGVPVPQKGLVAYFDELQTEIQNIKAQLESFLDSIRYQMKQPNLKFTHTKERFEIEVPEKAEKRRPTNFEFSSKRAGYSRYTCPEVKGMVKRLEKVEEDSKSQMGLFIGFFFEEFKKKQNIWQKFIDILAEVDCLISLAEYSLLNKKVRPQFVEHGFSIKGARHPALTNIEFIPNNVNLVQKVMLLTGPNMGGKSTLLRTVCCLAVLAQMGCYVPCEEYQCETIDRIFTRIGASDRLQLGKSTFFIEMEETKSILSHATNKSLAIIDELGRGTATFDGLAIAYAVLKAIISRLKCYCLFATHYHILIDEFRGQPEVSLMMMDSLIKKDHIIFLFKLVPGSVAKSFGLCVASRVGINSSTIRIAEVEAEKMNNEIEGKRNALNQVIQFINHYD